MNSKLMGGFLNLILFFVLALVSFSAQAQTRVFGLDGVQFQYKSVGAAVGAGWNIWSNGYIENAVTFPTSGNFHFAIEAYGSSAGGAWPILELRIEQQVVARATISSSSPAVYSFTAPVTAGPHKVEIAFTNDYYASGADRNLYVNHLDVFAPVPSAPDLKVASISMSPAVPVAGSAVTFSAVVTNVGSAATPAGVDLGVSFVVDGKTASATWGSTLSSLAPGASMTIKAMGPSGASAWVATSGAHAVEAFVDDVNRMVESSETNNKLIQSFSVGSAPTPTPTPAPTPASTGGTVGPTISTFKASGPITLVSGQTVTGLAISNPNGPCILGNGVSNVRIYNNKIGPCGTTPDDSAIVINSGRDILIDHNSIDDVVAGFFAYNGTNNLVFDHNIVTRIRGSFPRASVVQFHAVKGSGNRITCNISDQPTPGYLKGPEDQINMYMSAGTATSPILIKNNKIRGGGPSSSGGGINLGDEGSSYITAEGNNLVNPGQYGIAIPGGHDNKMINNKVYSASFSWSNVGMFVWNQYTPACYNATVTGNRVNWTNRYGVNDAGTNWWNSGNCGPLTQSNNVFGDPTIGAGIFNEVFPDCQ